MEPSAGVEDAMRDSTSLCCTLPVAQKFNNFVSGSSSWPLYVKSLKGSFRGGYRQAMRLSAEPRTHMTLGNGVATVQGKLAQGLRAKGSSTIIVGP